jgi:heat-inducible transcriptional repressor
MEARKQVILENAIQHYISTGEPVGSKVLAQSPQLQVSSATIRNELNELEKEGFLTQPHTSSGRVPTDKGYRYYVDEIATQSALSVDQQGLLKAQLQEVGNNVNTVLGQISDVLSTVVDYTTIVLTPAIYQETLKMVHMILVDLDKVLVVLLNMSGINSEFVLTLQDRMDQDDLNQISTVLTQKLRGKSLNQVSQNELAEFVAELPQIKPLLGDLVQALDALKKDHRNQQQVLTKGVGKLLKLPEFHNIELTQKVLATLEENRVLSELLGEYMNSGQCQVVIGQENKVAALQECSLVVSPLSVDQETVGLVGVLGPRRMSYAVVVPMVQHITSMVSEYLSRNRA